MDINNFILRLFLSYINFILIFDFIDFKLGVFGSREESKI